MKDRCVIEPAIPRLTGKHGDAELDRVDQNDSAPPRVDARQFHGGPQSLRQNTTYGDSKNDEHLHAPIIAGRL